MMRSPPEESCAVSSCIVQLRAGDGRAASSLWTRYQPRLVELARKKLGKQRRLIDDEEDIAISVFRTMCRSLEQGRFPQVEKCDDLWNLLARLTLRKVLHVVRDGRRTKRGGGWRLVDTSSETDVLDQLPGREPAPDDVAQYGEALQRFLAQLPGQELVDLLRLKLEGFTNAEISTRWRKAERTVERKLRVLRRMWGEFQEPTQIKSVAASRDSFYKVSPTETTTARARPASK